MTTFLLHGDALTSPDMRHEIGEAVADPITFIDHDGKRIVMGSKMEEPIFARREDVVDEFWNVHDLGSDELVSDATFDASSIKPELVARAIERLGARNVVVPPTFPVFVADYLRSRNITLSIDADAWNARRRAKTPWELEGIERAQRAAENAFGAAARMLRDAERTRDGKLRFEGEILHPDWIREAMGAELLAQGAESSEILIQTGDECLSLHDLGHSEILPDQSCVIDCFPKDLRTGVYTDMTRTFVPGTPSKELLELHAHCRAVLDLVIDAACPGADNLYDLACSYFEKNGFPTQREPKTSGELREGFCHGLGHGVGLEVHEGPSLGRRSQPLAAGDVIAIEPGLYFKGIGGVRLEDTVLITEDCAQRFTDPYPYDLQP